MRVLLVVSSSRLAGTERHVVELAAGLRAAGVDAEVACEPGGDGLDSVLARRDVPVHPVDLRPRSRAGSVLRLAALSRRFDVVHAHLTVAAAAAAVAGALTGRPVVETRHFLSLAHEARSGPRRLIGRARRAMIDCGINLTLAPSRVVAQRAGPKALLVPHGIPPINLPRRTAASAGRFLTVGRLERDRHHEMVLRAFAYVVRIFPSATLTVVGDGADRSRLETLGQTLGLVERVRFTGRLEDVVGEMSRAHIYLSPATEAFGLATLETMAGGLPVIGAARGALLDLVDHERTGLLVEPEPAAFAEAMVRLARDPAASIEMGEAGRRRASKEFSVEQMVRRTVDAYGSVLTDGSGPRRSSSAQATAGRGSPAP